MNKIKVISEFIENWKVEAIGFYTKIKEEKKEIRTKTYDISKDNLQSLFIYKHHQWVRRYSDEEIDEILLLDPEENKYKLERIHDYIRKSFYEKWRSKFNKTTLTIIDNIYNEDDIKEIVEKEAINKEINFYSKIEKKIDGKVTKVNLNIGDDGNINGYVVAENNTVEVRTVIAGGYNIQVMHYRVYVKEWK